VLVLILAEAAVIGVAGALLGLTAATQLIPRLMTRVSSDLSGIQMPASVFAWGAGIALVLALASGLPPALRARRLELVDALAGR
jgi:putative ABC transport system permease protein